VGAGKPSAGLGHLLTVATGGFLASRLVGFAPEATHQDLRGVIVRAQGMDCPEAAVTGEG
jgi:hypothetical protein